MKEFTLPAAPTKNPFAAPRRGRVVVLDDADYEFVVKRVSQGTNWRVDELGRLVYRDQSLIRYLLGVPPHVSLIALDGNRWNLRRANWVRREVEVSARDSKFSDACLKAREGTESAQTAAEMNEGWSTVGDDFGDYANEQPVAEEKPKKAKRILSEKQLEALKAARAKASEVVQKKLAERAEIRKVANRVKKVPLERLAAIEKALEEPAPPPEPVPPMPAADPVPVPADEVKAAAQGPGEAPAKTEDGSEATKKQDIKSDGDEEEDRQGKRHKGRKQKRPKRRVIYESSSDEEEVIIRRKKKKRQAPEKDVWAAMQAEPVAPTQNQFSYAGLYGKPVYSAADAARAAYREAIAKQAGAFAAGSMYRV